MNEIERSYKMTSNLCDLPYIVFNQLSHHLDSPNIWHKIFSDGKESVYYLRYILKVLIIYIFSNDEIDRYNLMPNPGSNFLRHLGARGETIQSFLKRLHALAKIYGEIMDRPQLTLRRKFCE